MTIPVPMIYPYRRVSTSKQVSGYGLELQNEDEICRELSKKYTLPIAETQDDKGLSAFHANHIKKGALGHFISSVNNGDIAEGSILVVYSLDRLSRQKIEEAISIVTNLINNGVMIYECTSRMLFGDHNSDNNSRAMQLQNAIFTLTRSHGESQIKSDRSRDMAIKKAAAFNRGESVSFGGYGQSPIWLTKNKFNEKAEAIKAAISCFQQGMGISRTVQHLNEHFMDLAPTRKNKIHKGWNIDAINNLRSSPSIYGLKVLNIDGHKHELQNYYPPLMTKQEFDKLQLTIATNTNHKAKTNYLSLLSNLNQITKCGDCGMSMIACKKRGRIKYICSGSMKHKSNCKKLNYDGELLERLTLLICADVFHSDEDFDDTELINLTNQVQNLKQRLLTLKDKYTSTGSDSILDIIVSTESALQKATEYQQKESARKLYITESKSSTINLYTEYENKQSFNIFNMEKRQELRKIIAESFESIEVSRKFYLDFNFSKSRKLNTLFVKWTFKDGTTRVIDFRPFEVIKRIHSGNYINLSVQTAFEHPKNPNADTTIIYEMKPEKILSEVRKHDLLSYAYPTRGHWEIFSKYRII